MIFLQFDECYAFDCFAVTHIKLHKERTMNNLSNYERFFSLIESQIGYNKMNEVLSSEEYINLFKANEKLFNGFNFIKTEEGKNTLAVDLDKINYERHLAKICLQNKYFPQHPIKEVKIGYDEKK